MGWKDIGKGKKGEIPIEKITDKGTRVRFIGPNLFPELAGSKFEEGVFQRWVHWAPEELKDLVKGPVPCIGPSKCLFHQDPLKWRSQCSNFVNAIIYDGVKAKERTYDSKRIVMLDIRTQIGEQIQASASDLGYEIDQVEWILTRSGKGINDTSYTATIIERPLEAKISLKKFEAQEEYADEDFPQLIDPTQFYANRPQTRALQEEWYEKLQEDERELEEESDRNTKAEKENTLATKPLPGKKTAPAAATKNKLIEMPGKRGVGRPPMKTPEAKRPPTKTVSAYEKAQAVLCPSGEPLTPDHEFLDFFATAKKSEWAEYGITPEIHEAAKIVLAGPSAEPETKRPPKASKAVEEAVEEEEEELAEEAETEENNVEILRADLLKHIKSLPTLKNLKNLQKFLKAASGFSAVSKIEDEEVLQGMIELCESGDEAVSEWLSEVE